MTKLRRRDVANIARRDAKSLRRWKQGIPLTELERGALIEIDSDLTAADIFRVRTAMVAVSDVMEAYPTFLSLEQREIFKTTRPLTDLIDRLNGGAIPVVGHKPKLVIEEIEDVEWLVAALPDESPSGRGVTIDSVVQPQWFWGDPGRTLFQNHRFRVLCRVVSATLSPRAASSYVGTILRTINDELAETVDGLGPMFLGALRNGHQRGNRVTSTSHELFDWYVTALSAHAAPSIDDVEIERISGSFDVSTANLTVDQQLRLFRSIDDVVFASAPDVSEEIKAALRDEARTKFGLWPWASGAASVAPQPDEHLESQYLEVEIVAVYW
ncbi:hypothetical protein [Agromyces sp. NPDC057865]|uniref:DUF6414 family protein n=1 Tax=Agromyces sp. NPDC057865 TaxID=3346267 RepID=UPI0036701B74